MMNTLARRLGVIAFVLFVFSIVGCSDVAGPGGSNGGGSEPVQFDSRAAPGDSARSFLDDRRFSVLNVEVDYMEGHEPTGEGLDSMKAELEDHLTKSTINVGTPNSIPAGGQNAYSADQVRDLEDRHRDHYTRAESDTIWAYVLVVDGEFSDARVLGIAYYNTSMAFFGQTIQEVSGGTTQPSQEKVEGTLFVHEFGHILGLVANGAPMQQDHHDEANGHHCTDEECVMYYAIETTDYFANLFDGTIPEFNQYCTQDMQALGGR